jgi:putative spermidine/putrescine transport system permease protein
MRHSRLTTVLMVAPLVALLLIFVVGILQSIAASVGYLPALGMHEFSLNYYAEMFAKRDVTRSIGLSLYISLASAGLSILFGVLIAAAVSSSGWANSKLMHLFKLPIIVPHTVCALLLLNLLSQNGITARLFFEAGLIAEQQDFFALVFDPACVGVILTYLWKEIPFVFLVVITIMAHIDNGLGQAAANLGASRLKTFFTVTLPLCLPSITTAFIIVFVYSFGAYEVPFLLGATEPKALPVQAYVEFVYPDLAHRPYAMVLNTIMIIFTLFISYGYYRVQGLLFKPERAHE